MTKSTVVAAAILIAALAAPAQAQDTRPPFDIEGGYIGFAGLLKFNLNGKTFDGETVYKEIDGEELLLLPKLTSRTLPKFIFGFRTHKGALEFSYERGRHDATIFDFPIGAVFNSFNVDGRFFFLKHRQFQPHLLLGLGFPWLTIEEGSAASDQPDAEVGDARWRGLALNTEVGMTVFVTPEAGVSVGYAYKLMYYSRARGVSDRLFELKPAFRETSGTVVVMGFYTFK